MIPLPSGLTVLERGWLSSNNVLCQSATHHGMIDSGYATHAAQTLALVRQALGGQPLHTLVNTHLHSDHCGGNAHLQAAYPALRTHIPAGSMQAVADWPQMAQHYASVGQHCPPFVAQHALRAGDTFTLGAFTWQALAAPGHDPLALMYYCAAERMLVSGDALWEHGFGVVFPELVGESGFTETRQTLNSIAALDVRWVIPGHGCPFGDVPAALERAFQRLDYLASEPSRHLQNAVRVLVKFKLLEAQRLRFSELCTWLGHAPLLQHLLRRLNDETLPAEAQRLTVESLTEQTVAALQKAGAAQRQGEWLTN